jgi:hypothetical protein
MSAVESVGAERLYEEALGEELVQCENAKTY